MMTPTTDLYIYPVEYQPTKILVHMDDWTQDHSGGDGVFSGVMDTLFQHRIWCNTQKNIYMVAFMETAEVLHRYY